MERKTILAIAAFMIMVLLLAIVTIGLMPLWLPVVLIKPSIIEPLNRIVMKNMTKQMVRGMTGGSKSAKSGPVFPGTR